MKKLLYVFALLTIISCELKTSKIVDNTKLVTETPVKADFTIAFGSCNNQQIDNPFWEDILKQEPDVWVWGGDVIYSDTEDMNYLEKNYNLQKNKPDYKNFIKNTTVLGTWDDHDYGVNDGGLEYPKKKAAQQLFLDFLDVPKTDIRREREGVYHSQTFEVGQSKIKIIILDTRYFRSALTEDKETRKRYKPNSDSQGTILGKAQWLWLNEQLSNSDANYHIIMSSVQFLSDQHGFETWGNMPNEVAKMEKLIVDSKAKGVIILSGDRHISEISQKEIGSENQTLIDFTSSGMTHAYTNFKSEPNPYRVSKVIYQNSYATLKFDFKSYKVLLEMWGENNELLDSYIK